MVDKVRASALREQGFQYGEIAKMVGCSEVWCKKNLKDVVKGEKIETDGASERMRAIAIFEEALMKLRGN